MSLRRVVIGALVLGAGLQPACLELETTNGSGGAGGNGTAGDPSSMTSSGGKFCETNAKGCEECVACASTFPTGPCAQEIYACSLSMVCVAIDDCFQACPVKDGSCLQGCLAMFTSGKQAYFDYNACVYCSECKSACSSTNLCLN